MAIAVQLWGWYKERGQVKVGVNGEGRCTVGDKGKKDKDKGKKQSSRQHEQEAKKKQDKQPKKISK